MILDNLKKAFKLIDENYESACFDGSKSISSLIKAEEALQVSFSKTYKEFLLKYGCGDIFGVEIYGLTHDDYKNSGIPNVVWITLNMRSLEIPQFFVIISETGNGFYYAIDLSNVDDTGESPIVIFDPINVNNYEIVARDFGSFLYEQILDMID